MGVPYNAGGEPLLVTADVNVGGCWNNATGISLSGGGLLHGDDGAIADHKSGYPIHP